MPKHISSILSSMAVIVALAVLPAKAQDVAGKVKACAACHGQDGVPLAKEIPTIWGQRPDYLYKELHDYLSGARDNPIMSPAVKGFTLPELRTVANYFAAETWPAKASAVAAMTAPPGMTTCHACHGEHYEGGPPGPRLAGQSYDYLLAAMNGFATGERSNNLDMPGFMKALTEPQREAIAHYLAGL
ncbi:MAG TPA: c-type cytochrome [Stellaceae bacterium]|nr:c-type cytochrome [Stellaceae bacterium]